MKTSTVGRPEEKTPCLSISSTLKWGALLVSIGSVALHVVGYTYHLSYFEHWGIDSSVFTKSIDWYLINGHLVVTATLLRAWTSLSNVVEWLLMGLFSLSLATAAILLLCLNPKVATTKTRVQHFIRERAWLHAIGFSFFYWGFLGLFLFVAPAFTSVTLVIPALIGSNAGKNLAETEVKQFSAGCETAEKNSDTPRCVSIIEEDKPTMRAFLLDSSQTHIAIFDPAERSTKVMARDKVAIIGVTPSSLKNKPRPL